MEKIKCVIIDDMDESIKILENHTKKIAYLDIINTFTKSIDALYFLEKNSVDIVFLDIHMPVLNGFQLIEKLRTKIGENVPAFIFTTGDKDMALPAYECGAIGYFVKSGLFKQFKITVERVLEIITKNKDKHISHSNSDYFFIESEGSRVKMTYRNIAYLECSGNYITFIDGSDDNRSIYNRPMHYMDSFLSNHGFIRVHKSFIVSIHHVLALNGNDIKVNVPGKGPKLIPVGATYKDEVRKRINVA